MDAKVEMIKMPKDSETGSNLTIQDQPVDIAKRSKKNVNSAKMWNLTKICES